MNLAVFGHGQPVLNALTSLLGHKEINVLNVEQDFPRKEDEQDDFQTKLKNHSISLNSFNKLNHGELDLVLVINYNRILNIDQFNNILALNIHMGLLPTYRGNNANAWAVINGENEVGYSIHKVADVLDAGDIYYTYKYDIGSDTSYFNAKKAIETDIKNNLASVILKIRSNEIIPASQDNKPFLYCTKLRPSDGVIKNWDVPGELLYRKSYVFGKPLGTGLKFIYKDKVYSIGEVRPIENYKSSIGIPGSVVFMTSNSLWIKTKDVAVELLDLKLESQSIKVQEHFKIGYRFLSE